MRCSSHDGQLKEEIAMRRRASALVLLAGLLLLSAYGIAQEDIPAGLVREDLQLISQESLSHWTPLWTGPIQAATIMAWFADHGYPFLMSDFNGDGVIDELDTIELANQFGLGVMEAESLRGATDVRLVIGLANYVAASYPGEFVLKIYDPSFSHEFTVQGFGVFEADAIPGIVLQLKDEPSIDAYVYEMATDEGVIVGLEEALDLNRYLSGRSYLIEETPAGYTPLDFAWAKEDAWRTGHQGQVLQTVGKMENRFLLEFLNEWEPVEFMLALSPLAEEEEGPPSDTNGDCPDLTVRVRDESCVYNPREQAYNITVWAEILNVGTEPVSSPFVVSLTSTTHPGGTIQVIPVPPVLVPGGILPVTMSFLTPPEPTGAAPCPLEYLLMVDANYDIRECDEENNVALGEVCCDDSSRGACCFADGSCAEMTAPECEAEGGTQFQPGVDCSIVQCPPTEEGCPDLVVEIVSVDSEYAINKRECEVTVVIEVTNIGEQTVTEPINVSVTSNCGSEFGTIFTDLASGDSETLEFTFTCSAAGGCEFNLTVLVDYTHTIDECDERNNDA
jgi:hypothetical protein